MRWPAPEKTSIPCRPMSMCGTAATEPTTTGSASTVPANLSQRRGRVAHVGLVESHAPAIDAIASDIYHQSPIAYLKILNNYGGPTTRC